MATITEDYVSFEIAKLLKEKGFNEPCECFYDTEHNDISIINGWMNISNSQLEEREFLCYSAPTHQMAMKWLREKKTIIINVWYNGVDWDAEYYNDEDEDFYLITELSCSSYEDACEESIKFCIEKFI